MLIDHLCLDITFEVSLGWPGVAYFNLIWKSIQHRIIIITIIYKKGSEVCVGGEGEYKHIATQAHEATAVKYIMVHMYKYDCRN